MSGDQAYAQALNAWYHNGARAFLSDYGPERVEQLDRDGDRLKKLIQATQTDLDVCFLGTSGVGKSTLLNALVARDRVILPQGGIGPLTAQAVEVRYSSEPYFTATYLPAARLNEVLFVLERHHEAELKKAGQAVSESSREIADTLSADDLHEAESTLLGADPGAEQTQDTSKFEQYRKRAQLLVRGSQWGESELSYLVDGLRLAIGAQPKWDSTISDDDCKRIDRIRECLRVAESDHGVYQRRSVDGDHDFKDDLDRHASGHLAPLIKTIKVGWPSDILREGMVLLDLPGLGTANDEYRSVTNEVIRSARVIVLVVERAGVTESSAQLLQGTGFFNALLHDSHDPTAEPITLVVAMVKVDLPADEQRRDERGRFGADARSWVQIFEEKCAEAVELVRGQMRIEIAKLVGAGPEITLQERQQAATSVLDTLQVHPVSAIEFRKWYLEDEDDRPKIKDPAQSRVPAFGDALKQLVATHRALTYTRLNQSAREFSDRVASAIKLIQAHHESDGRAEAEMDRLRVDLDAFLVPLRKEIDPRRGGFREFLTSTIPGQIDARVDEAGSNARLDISRYLARYDDMPWNTIRAAIRRGGVFYGSRAIDLPNELTLRFEEPIAVVWSKHILAALRKRTKDLSDAYQSMLDEIVGWAEQQGARIQPKLLGALRDTLKADTKGLATVGRDMIDELKATVKKELYSKVEGRVRSRCDKFVREGQDIGQGVKSRMLKMIRDELADSVVEGATPAARKVLLDNYDVVASEIRTAFKEYGDPIERAAEALISSHEVRVKRTDTVRRRQVATQTSALLGSLPEPAPAAGVLEAV